MHPIASQPTRSPSYQAGALVLLTAIAVILVALAFEHFVGLPPCPLCLEQRYAYYAGIPALFAALALLAAGWPRVSAAVFLLVAAAFLANSGLGAYHAGVEWKLWAGPDSCAGTTAPLGGGGRGILDQLSTTRVIRCDEAPWHLLGISLAGWNALASLGLSAGSLSAALKALRG
jgi:disulfide bond formation protein DsbB